jgi:hypothetical protein
MHAHTNHYVHDDMLPYASSGSDNSRARLRQARAVLAEGLKRETDPLQLVMDVLRSHADHSICEHPPGDTESTDSMTVGSMVCDLDNGRLYVCAGPPCLHPYAEHSL